MSEYVSTTPGKKSLQIVHQHIVGVSFSVPPNEEQLKSIILEKTLNLHSGMDLDGACGLWNSKRAELYSLVGERCRPPHTVHLGKQVHAGRAVVLEQARLNYTYFSLFYIFRVIHCHDKQQ